MAEPEVLKKSGNRAKKAKVVSRTVFDEYGNLCYHVYGSRETGALAIGDGSHQIWVGLAQGCAFIKDVKKVYQAVQGPKGGKR